MLREMASDPKFRKVLVTDGKSPSARLWRALVKAGADPIWVGQAEPWKQPEGFAELAALPQVTLVDLDVRDERSVQELAALIGAKVDIVVNTAELHRNAGIAGRRGTDVAREEMEVNYLGLLRLAQAFGPVLKARSADGAAHATAWVNLLSIYALSNYPAEGTFSASKAAALSLAQCLRAEMRGAGIRVVNVFPGPIDDEWNQNLPPPKLAPQALASAIVKALQGGVEDVYPGDIAQDWLRAGATTPRCSNVNSLREGMSDMNPSHPLGLAATALLQAAPAVAIRVIDLTQSARLPHPRPAARWASASRFASSRSRPTTSAAPPGTGTTSRAASTPARTSTRRSTGSPGAIAPTTRWTPCRPRTSSPRPA
jgi:NAD(P)-dependent dehydrogenase (short-subunit alcohol dehydrogenase family)